MRFLALPLHAAMVVLCMIQLMNRHCTLADLASSETAAELCLWTVKTEICCMWLPGEGRKRGPHDVDEPRPKHS